ncbi:MAG: dTMP kinase [Pseudomonadota bacterium]
MPHGLFITLDGIDGTGKSTQAERLATRLLETDKRPVVLTREPGGSAGAEAIRQLLVTGEPGRWSPITEALLFTAARRDHVERIIQPALGRGEIVICDRFIDSTRAYQGVHDTVEAELVDGLHRLSIGLEPDLTLILDLSAEIALSRTGTRQSPEDRFEKKGLAFQSALRQRFLDIAKAAPERCRVVDALGSQATVAERVWAAAAPVLASRDERDGGP